MCNDTGRVQRPVGMVECCGHCRINDILEKKCEQEYHQLRIQQSTPITIKASAIRAGYAIVPPGSTECLVVSFVDSKDSSVVLGFSGWGMRVSPDTQVKRMY